MKTNAFLAGAAAAALCALQAQETEFIVNGDFELPFADAGTSNPLDGLADFLPPEWTRYETFTGGEDVVEDSFITGFTGNGPSAPGVSGACFTRSDGDNASGDFTSVYQPLDITLDEYDYLDLSLDVMVMWHDLQAGGWSQPAFEWPVVVQVAYLDNADNVRFWRYGWYVEPPGDGYIDDDPGDDLIPVYNDQLVQTGVWASGQFDILQELPTQAVKVLGLLVGGSGWRFSGCVDNVSLLGTVKPLEVLVDIKPGSFPNSINPGNNGVIPVAILSTAEFDARAVDGASVRFGPGAASPAHGNGHICDVNRDGLMDWICHFPTQNSGLAAGEEEAWISGTMTDGRQIIGSDTVRVLAK